MRLHITVEGGEIIARMLGSLPERAIPELSKTLSGYVFKLHSHIVTNKLSGQVLNVQTGALRSGLIPVVAKSLGRKLVAALETMVRYWRIHEFGGTIFPRQKQALTVPFPGVTGWAADYENTFIAKGVIFEKQEGGPRPLFALRRSVTIPERSYLRTSLAETQGELVASVQEAILKAWER
jgi:hypothetical protein